MHYFTDTEGTVAEKFNELRDLLGIGADERVSICSQKPGGTFEHTTPGSRADAIALATSVPYAGRDVWFSVNPLELPAGYHGRGGDEHVRRCAALFADVDLKRNGVADPETAALVTKQVADALGQNPVAVVFSGHGGHPYWALDPADDAWTLDTEAKRTAAQAIYRRFHRLCADVAASFGGRLDNVGQLSRILRVPGTLNHKDAGKPVAVELTPHPFGSGGLLSFAEVAEALDAYGVPQLTEDTQRLGAIISEPCGWMFGHQTVPYVVAMVRGWQSDRPGSRHGWLVSQATRLACAYRLTRITEDDHARAVQVLTETFGALLRQHGEARTPTPGEVAGALAWGMSRASSMTEDQAAGEVGGALHGDGGSRGDEQMGLDARLTLPPEVWESRDSLRHIRDAAWSMLASPDAVLAITLARLSASIPPAVRVDTGLQRGMPTHTFAALVGRSGGFKSSAMEAAELAVSFSRSWQIEVMDPDRCPVLMSREDDPGELAYLALGGTGQGIVENFMGEVPVPVPEGAPRTTKPGKLRRQVRSNVLVTIDEGNGLAKALADANSIVGETLRELWSGSTTGQGNAKGENSRGVRRGSYSFGLIVGFQVSVLARLLAAEHVELGTPQRFLFSWTGAPDIPDERVPPPPGRLDVTIPADPISLCPALMTRIRAILLPLLRNGGTDDETDSQRVSLVVRLAALLAILDGRSEVVESDWTLAETMADTSRSIAAHALTIKREKATRARTTLRAEHVADAIAIHTATEGSGPERAAARIETAVRTEGAGGRRAKWTGDDGIRRGKFAHHERDDADKGLELLRERGTVVTSERGKTIHIELTQ